MTEQANEYWPLGEEREVRPGNYACPIQQVEDWVIWTLETAAGKFLGINKPAIGGNHPVPLGVAQAFFSTDPYVSILFHPSKSQAWFYGKHPFATAEFREVGGRFMTRWERGFDPLTVDGKKIEAVISSMPTERSYSKLIRQSAVFDFTGANEVLNAAASVKGIRR